MSIREAKVSVILPFFNAENTLDRAIQSIYEQSFRDFDCYLVDNNSTDRSRNLAEAWTRRDKRFKLVSEDRQGVHPRATTSSRSTPCCPTKSA